MPVQIKIIDVAWHTTAIISLKSSTAAVGLHALVAQVWKPSNVSTSIQWHIKNILKP